MSKSIAPSSLSRSNTDNLFNHRPAATTGLLFCLVAFLFCILISITPLNRLQALVEIQSWPTTKLLLLPGSWLPIDLKLTDRLRDSQMSTHLIWLLLLIALEFLTYILGAWWINRKGSDIDKRYIPSIIWLGILAAGLVFVFTPAMLSRDVFVYAGYGRVFASYHANPYFVPLSAYPQDTLIALDDWNTSLCAYGPLWVLICGLSSLLAGNHALTYVFFYRLLGFSAHALNTLLVARTLRTMGKAPHTVATGMLLYGWNPLVLQESCLGGHNDTLMVTFLLLGLLLCVRVEQNKPHSLTATRSYLPPLLAFTLATLIKFTSGAFIALFLILLMCKLLQLNTNTSVHLRLRAVSRSIWSSSILTIVIASLISAGVAMAFYTPFWLGHSPRAILASFSSPPSARAAYGSILGAILNWEKASGGHYEGWSAPIVLSLSQHQTWQNISTVTVLMLLLVSIIWLWYAPTTRTLMLAAQAMLGAVLIVTPWFFPWYVTWLVGLAALCLPVKNLRTTRALFGFTLTFSASAYFIYFFRGYQPVGDWLGWTFLTTIGPPLIVLLSLLLWPAREL